MASIERPRGWGVALGWVLLCLASPCRAYVALLDSGPASNRVDIVFVGDGYTADQLPTYAQHADSCLQHLFAEGEDPFPRYRNFFNACRIDIVSNETGCDQPDNGIYRDTALNATFQGSTDRSLVVNHSLVSSFIAAELSPAGVTPDLRVALVNTSRYGGTGGSVAVCSAAHASANEIALHEIGHTFADLADEYVSYDSAYSGSEPPEANVTLDPAGQKWDRWLGYVDPQHPGMSPVGAYEGARYYATGIFRPTLTSKMRSLYEPFNAVSREQIILTIYACVDPLDAWADNAAPLSDPAALWVDTVDPEVIKVQWSLDGAPLAGATRPQLELGGLGLSVGPHTLTALACDETEWVRLETDALRQTISWQVLVNWLLGDGNTDGAINALDIAPFVGMLTGASPFMEEGDLNRDGVVNALDVSLFVQALTAIPRSSQAVPEPRAAMFLLLAAAFRNRGRVGFPA